MSVNTMTKPKTVAVTVPPLPPRSTGVSRDSSTLRRTGDSSPVVAASAVGPVVPTTAAIDLSRAGTHDPLVLEAEAKRLLPELAAAHSRGDTAKISELVTSVTDLFHQAALARRSREEWVAALILIFIYLISIPRFWILDAH